MDEIEQQLRYIKFKKNKNGDRSQVGSVANFLKVASHVIIIPVLLVIGDINYEKHV